MISIYKNILSLIIRIKIYCPSYFEEAKSNYRNVCHFFAFHASIWAYSESGDSDASNELLTHDYSPYIEELAL